MRFLVAFLISCSFAAGFARADQPFPVQPPPPGYEHNKWGVSPVDIERDFQGFTVSFDGKDDDGTGHPLMRRIPEWVAQQVDKWPASKGACIPTGKRPSPWFTDKGLEQTGVAPNDDSYKGSGYDRGHMAAKLLVERLGEKAAWNTHTVLNAVPQDRRFNQQIWRALEDLTGAWAQIYGKIWLVQGPVFDIKTPSAWIGDGNEPKVAVPPALFKIVIRERTPSDPTGEGPMVLAFLMPQLGPGYYGPKSDFRLERFLTSIDEIEKLTGLTFLTHVPKKDWHVLKSKRAAAMWPVPDKSAFLTGCKN